jgi:predicted N-acetyltransferase YhbS
VAVWVRHAVPDDAAALSALAVRAKSHWGYPPEWIELWRAELTMTPEYLARHLAFIAAEDGVPLGMCVLERRDSGWSLENVWIAPDRHRQGVGRALVIRALREAAAAGARAVRVVSDPFAEGFYTRLGAERRGEIPSPMPGAPDRTLPVLEFEPPSVGSWKLEVGS